MSSDEYMFELIKGELEHLCPGRLGCHGCQTWCPLCGGVENVCDNPECDRHLRPPDIEAQIQDEEARMKKEAEEARRWERRLVSQSSPMPTAGATEKGCRQNLARHCGTYAWSEREIRELEEKLHEARTAGNRLRPRDWPRLEERPRPDPPDPRQLRLPIE